MGVAHTEALRRLGLDVVGIVGSSPERARAKAAPRRPLPPIVDSVEELLADPAVEVVHVTSPNHLHAAHVRAAIAAGKHVVCEKPLGVSAAETAELLARGRGRRRRPRRLLQPALLPAEPERRGPRRRRRDRRATLRHRPLPPGLAAARHRLELAPRRRPPGRAAGRRRHRVALARPGPVRHRPPGGRGVRRPAHVRHRAQPPDRRGRDVRRAGVAATSSGCGSTWRATTPPGCCCASRTAPAARARSARCRPGARTRSSGRWPARRRAGVGVGGPRAAVDRPSRPAQRGHREGPGDHDAGRCRRGGLPGRSRRGLPGHVPRPVRRRLPRRRRRRTVAAPDVPDVRRRPRRRAGVRGDRRSARSGTWTKVERTEHRGARSEHECDVRSTP